MGFTKEKVFSIVRMIEERLDNLNGFKMHTRSSLISTRARQLEQGTAHKCLMNDEA